MAIGGENVTAKVEIYKNVDYPYGGQDNDTSFRWLPGKYYNGVF